jgi:1-deoxy-D-xylulose-5-phosphate reductoisomerase
MKKGGNAACILNAANEIVVDAFLKGNCGFVEMSSIIEKTLEKSSFVAQPLFADYVESDKEVRQIATSLLKVN